MIFNSKSPYTSVPRILKLGPLAVGVSYLRPTRMKSSTHGFWTGLFGLDLSAGVTRDSFAFWFGPHVLGFGFHLHLWVEFK